MATSCSQPRPRRALPVGLPAEPGPFRGGGGAEAAPGGRRGPGAGAGPGLQRGTRGGRAPPLPRPCEGPARPGAPRGPHPSRSPGTSSCPRRPCRRRRARRWAARGSSVPSARTRGTRGPASPPSPWRRRQGAGPGRAPAPPRAPQFRAAPAASRRPLRRRLPGAGLNSVRWGPARPGPRRPPFLRGDGRSRSRPPGAVRAGGQRAAVDCRRQGCEAEGGWRQVGAHGSPPRGARRDRSPCRGGRAPVPGVRAGGGRARSRPAAAKSVAQSR